MKNSRNKQPWPTKAAMVQVYKNKLWGGGETEFYSGEGSHHLATVQAYVEVVVHFLKSFNSPLSVCDLGCGDFNIGKQLVNYTKSYNAIDIVPDLIAYNQKSFVQEGLVFYNLDIAKDNLPVADCAIVRQVLQHLSNAEIKAITEKLYAYKYIILTEHLPDKAFKPNIDIISGQGIRLKKHSGVDLLAAPFHFQVKEAKQLLNTASPGYKGKLVTTLYQVF